MMGFNPWLLIGALSAILASFIGGISVGTKMERTEWLERKQAYQAEVQAETDRANQVAVIYGESLGKSQDTVFNLRRKLNEQRDKLASCLPGGGVRLTDSFVGVFNEALQSNAADSSKPTGEASGADPVAVLDTHIENGRRWKGCRDQLNSIIDILEAHK